MLGAGCVSGNEGQVDVSLLRGRELLLGVLGGLLQALERHGVLAQVDAVLLLELVGCPVDHALVPVIAAQVVVAVGGKNLNHAVREVKQRDVEGAAAQVEDEDLLLGALLVQAVGKGSGRRLVDDTLDVETSDLASVLGGLTLGVVKVRRDGDDSLGDGLAEVLLGVSLHLAKNHGADLLRREVLAINLDNGTVAGAALDGVRDGLELGADLVIATAHETLDREDRVLGVGDGLVLGGLAHDTVAVGTEANNGRRGAVTLGVHDDGGLAALEDGHCRVGCTKVNTENLAHGVRSFPFAPPRHSPCSALCSLLYVVSYAPCRPTLYII